jgi:hypothetical protein
MDQIIALLEKAAAEQEQKLLGAGSPTNRRHTSGSIKLNRLERE